MCLKSWKKQSRAGQLEERRIRRQHHVVYSIDNFRLGYALKSCTLCILKFMIPDKVVFLYDGTAADMGVMVNRYLPVNM